MPLESDDGSGVKWGSIGNEVVDVVFLLSRLPEGYLYQRNDKAALQQHLVQDDSTTNRHPMP